MAASVEGNLAWDGCKGRSKNGTRSFESGDDERLRCIVRAAIKQRDFVTFARVISSLLNLPFC